MVKLNIRAKFFPNKYLTNADIIDEYKKLLFNNS